MTPSRTSSSLRQDAVHARGPAGPLVRLLAPVLFPFSLIGLALGAALLAPACDNPACVFSEGGCFDNDDQTQGAIGDAAATLPEDGHLIRDEAPTVSAIFPSGNGNAQTTPIVIVFTESMAQSSLNSAYEVVPLNSAGFPGLPIPTASALIGDGRVLVLLPLTTLMPGLLHAVQYRQNAAPRDLTGQLLASPQGELTTFGVAAMPPAAPRLVGFFPLDGSLRQSDSTEMVLVFDREMVAASVEDGAVVTVDGAAPAMPIEFTPLQIAPGTPPEPRVFRANALGSEDKMSFGTSAMVEVELSPAGDPIMGAMGGTLANLTRSFTTNSLAAPLGAGLFTVSQNPMTDPPLTAIGLPNLLAGDPEELQVNVALDSGAVGDDIDLFLFGMSLGTDSMLVALQRSIELAGSGPFATATFSRADVNLTQGSAGTQPRFLDGDVAFAFRIRRGNEVTPLKVLDTQPNLPDIQDPLLDTEPPATVTLTDPSDSAMFYRSDVRQVVVSGEADEEVGSVEVRALDPTTLMLLGDNGVRPPPIGATSDGRFLSAPVALSTGGPYRLEVRVYDRALNAADPITVTFERRGFVSGTSFTPGDLLTVRVYDALTLAPILGARVMTHEDDGSAYGLVPSMGTATTPASGVVQVASAGGSNGTILTVDATGYDLFTFHGVPSADLGIPLMPSNLMTSQVDGDVLPQSFFAQVQFLQLQRKHADSRLPERARRVFGGDTCTGGGIFGGGEVMCGFGPVTIEPHPLGAQSMIAGDFFQTSGGFDPTELIAAFALSLPLGPPPEGGTQGSSIEVPVLLGEPGVPPSELATEVQPTIFSSAFNVGIDFGMLADDPETTGVPEVLLEAVVPGIRGTVPVGMGLAFDQGGGQWEVRAARPGSVATGGLLAENETVDPDLLLRVEVREMAAAGGAIAGQRPRLSALGGLPAPNTLFAANVPDVVLPAAASTVAPSFDLVFRNAIVDLAQQNGIYRATLTAMNGRRWELYRLDEPDAFGDMTIRVPDVAAGSGTPLVDGPTSVTVSAYSWPGLDPTQGFLWTDIEREHDAFAHSPSVDFTIMTGP